MLCPPGTVREEQVPGEPGFFRLGNCCARLPAAAVALAGLCLAVPGAARADVLEVRPGGYTWIAGGPKQAEASDTMAALAAAPGALPGTLPETLVVGSAGPAPYRDRVAELAAKYDLSPSLIEALVWQESRWRSDAMSPAGARGLAQLMPATARSLGVDPDDPHANLEGGARYLRQQLDAFGGDLEKALAAYNAGPARVARAGGVPAIRETQNYVAAVMGRLSEPVRR
jgi:soluble lytic murein transglycosylase-like protein